MNKGKITTLIAITGGVLYVANYFAAYFGLIDHEMFNVLEKALIISVPLAIGLASKDFNQSHTK